MSQSTTSNFRYDINALRAIAVAAVLFFHYKIPGFTGGFSGVDVFFVISGYLMSKIILSGIDNGNFSIIDFYGKRLKRIVPALLFVISAVVVIGFFCYFPGDYQRNQKNAVSSILFLSNIFYWQNSGYFAAASDTNIFLHTWSLSVEWQFYMLYPIILLGTKKLIDNKAKFLIVFTSATLLICIASIVYAKIDKNAAFYLLPTRCWEMMFGGIALLSQDYFHHLKGKKILALIGYLAIFVGMVILNSDLRWPGIYTIIPVLATFLVITLKVDFKLLQNPVIQFVGKISYSLYLWHWPVYVMAKYIDVALNPYTIVLMICISIAMGYLSFKYVESFKFENAKPILALMLVLVGITGFCSFYNTNRRVFKPEALAVFTYEKRHLKESEQQFKGGNGACFVTEKTSQTGKYDKLGCLTILPGKKNILLIGDSHSAHLAGPLKKTLEKMNINLMQASASGCLPFVRTNGFAFCSEIIDYTYKDFVVKNADKIDGVMISANWILIKDKPQFLKDMQNTLNYLRKFKLKTIIIGQNETYAIPYPTIKAKEIQYNISLTKRYISTASYDIDKFIKKNFRANYVSIINDTIPGLKDNEVPYIFDKHHFTVYGADLAIKKILADPITKELLK
jgi:peptidoglycan/LPS O-acetylase OafA/YrhL